jgi:hypothetical protein
MTGRPCNAHRALIAALKDRLADVEHRLEQAAETPWASMTFTGARHSLNFVLSGNGAAAVAKRFSERISEDSFDIAGHVVADILTIKREAFWEGNSPEVRLGIEALTVEAA